MPCCREALAGLNRANGSNAGLLLAKYLHVQREASGDAEHPEDRKTLMEAARTSGATMRAVYEPAFERRKQFFAGLEKEKRLSLRRGEFKVQGRLVAGLGNASVLETGCALHHTYGVPYVPGSALKGLASHYCDQVWGVRDPGFKRKGRHFTALFGAVEDGGHITFHDGWILPQCLSRENEGLVLDVMTPHHGDYYASGGKKDGKDVAPTDFDDPNPVLFLSVAGTFELLLTCDDPSENGQKWCALAFALLAEALRDWGIGGKTNAGYGRGTVIQEAVQEPPKTRDGKFAMEQEITITCTGKNKKGNSQYEAPGKVVCRFASGDPKLDKNDTVQVRIVAILNEGAKDVLQVVLLDRP